MKFEQMLMKTSIVLTFFPSLLFFVFPGNQIQPVYILPVLLILAGSFRTIYRHTLPLFILLLISIPYYMVSIIYYSDMAFSTTINYISYLCPPMFYFALIRSKIEIKSGLLTPILLIWTCILLHQNFAPHNVIGDAIQNFLRFFIADRFSMYSISSGDRGGSGLTAEPAGAALIIIQFIFFYRYLVSINGFQFKARVLWVACIALMILSNTSGTLALLLVVYMTAVSLQFQLRKVFLTAIAAITSITLLYQYNLLGRIGSIFDELLLYYETLASTHILFALTFFMGMRVYNWIYSYGSIVNNFSIGHGIGGWQIEQNMRQVIAKIGWNPSDFQNFTNITYESHIFIKPWSFLSIWTFDMGLVAVVFLTLFFAILFRKVERRHRPDFYVALVIILFFPPISIAVPWLLMGLSLRKNQNKWQ